MKNSKLRQFALVATLFLLVFAPATLAQEEEKLADNSVNPGNVFYGLDVFFDNQRINNAVPGIDRARIALEVANERIEELRKVDRSEHIELARKNRDDALKKLEEEKEKLTAEEKQEIEENMGKNIEALNRVISKITNDGNPNNDNALIGLNRAISEDKQSLERIRRQVPAEVSAKEIEVVQRIESQRKESPFQFGRKGA